MPLTPDQIKTAAAALYDAEQTRRQIGLLSSQYPDMDLNDAYSVQDALTDHKRDAGRTVIGWKIGLTSKAMQYALNINIPDSGVLFDDMDFPNKGTVPAGRFIQPRVEAEIAFVLKAPLAGKSVTRDDVIAATDYVSPALEVLDTRILRADPETGATRLVFDTISDNAANGGIVMGAEKHKIENVDLRWVGAIVSRNGEVEETGLGAGVLNDPVTGIVWLVHRLADYGQSLSAGQVVLSGSFIRPIECPNKTHIHADFGPFGSVDCHFE